MAELTTQQARLRLLEFVRNQLSDDDLELAQWAVEAIERSSGCNTPAEEFLCSCIRQTAHGMTPEDVQRDLVEFEQNFADVVTNCMYAHRFYPKLASGAAEAALLDAGRSHKCHA